MHSLELIPEPDNPYDHYAISVRYKGSIIGYIPKERTHKLSRFYRSYLSGWLHCSRRRKGLQESCQ
ncbi:HIRAN domain-containing protein [Corynebacterium pyruviciproducens]|uniref:HIRAN domain-containing protein n=1 Tax=Corynebacterium pyruviciproducens TaxID=598660 RepID=UPI00254C51B5|nr:HIRAN domain-containing protein [Corynebacterium pyruviciproducens]MDK7215227.1 HIRAN domain-containing protein [Corynebacterium pyruviciproducens]